MQTSPWLAALAAIGKSLTFGGEDRAAVKWMLGALPGIKAMKLTAASGHRDTDAAWVARRGEGPGVGEKQQRHKP